jgi:diadenosine tetraphosphate (Ap4A) HIT family hydrolase
MQAPPAGAWYFPPTLIFRVNFRMDSGWFLHPQLERDCVGLGDLALSRVLVNNDANYPWLILVPRRPDLVEIIDLDDAAQAQLMGEIARVARALREVTACHKLNIAALGNAVPQLHVHVIARFRHDPAWPNPVWNVVPRRAYAPAELDQFIAPLRAALGLP